MPKYKLWGGGANKTYRLLFAQLFWVGNKLFQAQYPAVETCRACAGDGRLMPWSSKLFGGMLVGGVQALDHLTLHADATVPAVPGSGSGAHHERS